MVEVKPQWELSEISDERVRRAMQVVPRHLFVPAASTAEAYHDRALPIGRGQTISQPTLVAAMTEALHPQEEHRVLEVGTGSGYQTAILAELVQTVYSVEIDPELSNEAGERLRQQGYQNIHLRVGDGCDGWVEEAPFDSIIVTAAVEDVPSALMDQLKDRGRLVLPLGTPFGPQELTRVEKHGRDVITKSMMPVQFVSLRQSLSQ